MRLFLITLTWCLNYLFFKIVLFGNRRVLSRFEKALFKVVPLKPVASIKSSVALDIQAEYDIPQTRTSHRMLQYACSGHFYAGDRNDIRDDRLAVHVRVFSPVATKQVLLNCNYTTLKGLGSLYSCQEFSDTKPGWFDGVIFVNTSNKGES